MLEAIQVGTLCECFGAFVANMIVEKIERAQRFGEASDQSQGTLGADGVMCQI